MIWTKTGRPKCSRMIDYTFAKTEEDLEGILALQVLNLPGRISAEEALEQGSITSVTDFTIVFNAYVRFER